MYTLHKALLCNRSTYLANQLNRSHAEDSHAPEGNSNDNDNDDDENNGNNDDDANTATSSPFTTPGTVSLPDTDAQAFDLFVRWLYASSLPAARSEDSIGALLDAYFLAQTLQLPGLTSSVLEQIRAWYDASDTVPALRRLQYVYENTPVEDPLRALVLGAVARYLVVGIPAANSTKTGFPPHWDKALRRDGRLAVDLLIECQRWRLEEASVPDVRREAGVAQKLITEGGHDVEFGGGPGDEGSGEGQSYGEQENDVTDIKLEDHDEQGSDGGQLANGIAHDEAEEK